MNASTYAPPTLLATFRAVAQLRLATALSPAALKKFLFAALAATGIAYLLFRRANPERFTEFTVNSLTLTILPLFCLSYCGGFLRNEIRDGTIEYLWTRPVARYHLLLATYAGGVLTLFAATALLTTLIHIVAAFHHVPNSWLHYPQLLLAQFATILTYSAFALALSAYTRRYMPLGLVYGLIVEVGVSQISTNINNLAASRHIRALLNYATQETTATPLAATASGLLGCLALTTIFLVIACLVFTRTQYSTGSEKEG